MRALSGWRRLRRQWDEPATPAAVPRREVGRCASRPAGMGALMGVRNAAVAAADQWIDPDDGIRYPAGEVHAWERGRNETVCGLSLSRSRLARFPHVSWEDVQPESGRHAEAVQAVCRRCRAAQGARRDERGWTRSNPRP
jgi:hypothetical protein